MTRKTSGQFLTGTILMRIMRIMPLNLSWKPSNTTGVISRNDNNGSISLMRNSKNMHDGVGESNPQGTGCNFTTDINDLCTNQKIP